MKQRLKKYWTLFISTFYLSAFTFGGGYVIVPLMRKKFVEGLKWLEENEMADITAIAQTSPGAIAVNAAILLGYKTGGIIGALVALLGTVIPPFAIITAVSFFYAAFRDNPVIAAMMGGMQAGIAAVICDAAVKMGTGVVKEKNLVSVIVMPAAFVASFFFKINLIYIILACAVISVSAFLIRKAADKKRLRASCLTGPAPFGADPDGTGAAESVESEGTRDGKEER